MKQTIAEAEKNYAVRFFPVDEIRIFIYIITVCDGWILTSYRKGNSSPVGISKRTSKYVPARITLSEQLILAEINC